MAKCGDKPKLLAIGIAPLGIISIGIVPMGVVSIGVVPMGVLSLGAVGMGVINICVVGMGIVVAGVNVMGIWNAGASSPPPAPPCGQRDPYPKPLRLPKQAGSPDQSQTAGLQRRPCDGFAVDALRHPSRARATPGCSKPKALNQRP